MKHSSIRKSTFSLATKILQSLINTTYSDLRTDYCSIWTRLKFTSCRQFAKESNGRTNTLRQKNREVPHLTIS